MTSAKPNNDIARATCSDVNPKSININGVKIEKLISEKLVNVSPIIKFKYVKSKKTISSEFLFACMGL